MNLKETQSDLADLAQIIAELSQPTVAKWAESKWPTADEIRSKYRLGRLKFKALATYALSQGRLKVGFRFETNIIGNPKRVPTYLFTGGSACKTRPKRPIAKRRSSSTRSSRTSTSTRNR